MLWRKFLRDLKENKGAYIACISIIVLGLMVFTSFSIVLDNLQLSQRNFYYNQNFAHGFAEVQALPYNQLDNLRSLEGIKDLQGRLIKDVRVILPGREENIYLRLVSVDPDTTNPVNGVRLEMGVPLENDILNIWIDNKFFAANKLELNETIEIIAGGKKRGLTIAGVGISPEFMYAMRTASDLFPKPEEFGIAYMPYDIMKTLFEERDTVNSIVFTLKPDVTYKTVENTLKPELQSYGLKSIFPQKDQTSHIMLSQELEQLKSMGKTLPVVFLSVASMILYIMLKRMIENQRGQIGILKAIGYTRREIMMHYMSYALAVGLAGGILGGVLGIALSHPFTALYQQYFNIPGLASKFSFSSLILSLVLPLIFCSFAGYRGSKGVLTLDPAEAMKPPILPRGKNVLLERITLFWKMLTVQGKMAVRNIFRNPGRSFFVFLGMMFTFALLGMSWSMWELSEEMLFAQFEKVETYDLKISLERPLNQNQVERELSRIPGVNRVESKAEVPVTLKNKWHKKDLVLLGLPSQGELHKILDINDRQITPPHKGIIISQRLAQLLDASPGSTLTLESLMLKDPDKPKDVEVVGIIPQYLGLNAYMEIESLQNLLDQGPFATTIMLKMNEDKIPLLHQKYKDSAVITGIEDRLRMFQQLKTLMASFSGTIYIFMLIGVIVGFAIIYNSSIITLSERSRELASMRVLGMTEKEVLSVITFEQWFLAFFGMLAGIPFTKLLLVSMAQSLSNDVYSMPSSMGTMSIVVAFFVTIISILIAQGVAAKKIRLLQIAEVLKARE